MEGVYDLFKDKEEKGSATIKRFTINDKDARFHNISCMMNDGGAIDFVKAGNYVKLIIDREIFMSDTPMERRSNIQFVSNANGRVFIAGLGIGLIVHNILKKKEVTEVVVIESNQDVIDLVGPKFSHDSRVKIVHGDVLEFMPVKGDLYDTVYFDIWCDISDRNYPQMKLLHKRWKYNLNRQNPNAFIDSWSKDRVKKMARQDKYESFNSIIERLSKKIS